MNRADFLIPFVGIIVGLGVADLLLSVHRAIRAGVRWHPLPAAWATIAFMYVLMYWFVLGEIIQGRALTTFFGFAFHLGTPILLFLLCAAALPDRADPDEPLVDYYFGNRRYFFGLLAAHLVHGALDYGFGYGEWDRLPPWLSLGLALPVGALAFTDRRAVHAVVTVAVAALLTVGVLAFGGTFG